MRGRPTVQITLTDEERAWLAAQARRRSASQDAALRSKIVLLASEGMTNAAIARRLGCHVVTVGKWRRRFASHRLEGLADAPRPGAKRTITDEKLAAILRDTLETTPPGATHWSTRAMARCHGISATSVSTIWRAFGLQPHRFGAFKLSPDPFFVEKVRDIVGLYLSPPLNAVVLAVDEKPHIPARNRTAPILPMLPTTPARATHDYRRKVSIDLFAALDTQTGRVISECRQRHTAKDFTAFLNTIDRSVPGEVDVHLVLDNLATHKTPLVRRWLQRHRRFKVHYTATYSSWLNLVERWFSALTTKQLQRSSHRSVAELVADIEQWVEHWNEDPQPFLWHKTADDIRERLAGYCAALTAPEQNTVV